MFTPVNFKFTINKFMIKIITNQTHVTVFLIDFNDKHVVALLLFYINILMTFSNSKSSLFPNIMVQTPIITQNINFCLENLFKQLLCLDLLL